MFNVVPERDLVPVVSANLKIPIIWPLAFKHGDRKYHRSKTLLFHFITSLHFQIDDSGMLTQKVACIAPANSFIDCHAPARTLCELMWKCGSNGRPVPCECAVKRGYPDPVQVSGDQSFSDVCGTKRSNGGTSVPYDDDAYQSE